MIGRDPRPGEEHIRRTKELAAILVPALREVARRHGYALAVHGSLERDIDLLAAPWRDLATDASSLMRDMYRACEAIVGYATGPGGWTEKEQWGPPEGSLPKPERKPHGRLGWSILFGGGPYLDVSVMPLRDASEADAVSTPSAPKGNGSASCDGEPLDTPGLG